MKNWLKIPLTIITSCLLLTACQKDRRLYDQDVTQFLQQYGKENPEDKVTVQTVGGDFTIKLYPQTPLHRANFIRMVKTDYYVSRMFYRNIYHMGIQGGGEYMDQLDYLVPAEYRSELTHKRGAVAMARYDENNPERASSPTEFYIITNEAEAKQLNGNYVVFGEVIAGMEVVDAIQQAKEYNEIPAIPVFFKIKIAD